MLTENMLWWNLKMVYNLFQRIGYYSASPYLIFQIAQKLTQKHMIK